MPLFSYTLSLARKTKKGVLRASSYETAKQQLTQKKEVLISLHEIENVHFPKIKPAMVLEMTKDIYHLLRSRLSLHESLLSCEEKYAHSKLYLVVAFLADQVHQGISLSDAMQKLSHSFDAVYISLIRAAESSGSLIDAFKALTNMLERRASIKAQLQKAVMYPLFILSFALIMLFFLFWTLIPQLREFFMGKDLHPMTKFVLSVSDGLHAHGGMLFIGLSIFTIGIGKWLFHKKRKGMRQKIVLSIPLVSSILVESNWLKCTQTLAVLLSVNVPLQEALSLAKHVVTIERFQEALHQAQERLEQGKSLHQMFNNISIPPILLRMLATAEKTGETATMLGHSAEIFETSLNKKLHQLTLYLQPLLLVAIGAIIAFVILAVLLPLSDMGSF